MEPPKEEETIRMSEEALPRAMARSHLPHLRIGALLAVAAAAFVVAWLVLDRGGDEEALPPLGTAAASENQLKALADSVDQPIYWAGARKNRTYELTRTSDGRVYVRYLPPGVQVGDKRARYLTVGTYPRRNAFAELERAARPKDAVSLKIARGGLVVFSEAKPTSVYFGYPKSRYQVEVYHPSADVARRLVLSGQVAPIE